MGRGKRALMRRWGMFLCVCHYSCPLFHFKYLIWHAYAIQPFYKYNCLIPNHVFGHMKPLWTTLALNIYLSFFDQTYDGDTAQTDRLEIRSRCRLLITNPDMLHLSILPCHGQFAPLLSNLKYVVIDEVSSDYMLTPNHGRFWLPACDIGCPLGTIDALQSHAHIQMLYILCTLTPQHKEKSYIDLLRPIDKISRLFKSYLNRASPHLRATCIMVHLAPTQQW